MRHGIPLPIAEPTQRSPECDRNNSLDTNGTQEIGNRIHTTTHLIPAIQQLWTIGQNLRTNDQCRFLPLYIHSCVDANESRPVAGKGEDSHMFGKKSVVALILGASAVGLPAFGQGEESKSDVTVQALGSFVKDTTDNGVTHSASNSGGVLGTYRYYFGRHNGVEFNYGYTLNSQRYALDGNIASTKAYSHEATAAYVWRLPLRRITPFALAGAGSLIFDPKDIGGTRWLAQRSSTALAPISTSAATGSYGRNIAGWFITVPLWGHPR